MSLESGLEAAFNAVGVDVKALHAALATKVDKVTGYGLSQENFTPGEKSKLAGIATNANNYTHPNSGVSAGTYKSVTVNAQGHVTGGSNPTTLSGYGITDAAPSSHVGSTGGAHGVATTSAAGFMSSADKQKLDGIAAGAQVNTVTSVAGKTGAVALVKSDVGLGSVDNTADSVKPVSTAQQAALDLKANLASPALTGTPTAPTAASTTNTTQIATTAFVQAVNSSDTGSAATAVKLKTARTISATGDASWSASFDGSGNSSAALTLANTGVTAGTYPKVTVDSKGRVTAGAPLAATDVPNLDASKITGGTIADARLSGTYTGVNITGNAATATKLQTARTVNGTNFDGTANITTANWGTARNLTIGSTAKSVNGSANVTWSLSEIGAAAASHTHANATHSAAGYMSAQDKAKLDALPITVSATPPTNPNIGDLWVDTST